MEAARVPGSESTPAQPLAVRPRSGAMRRVGSAARDVQEVWFALARLEWRSLALVPADEGGSAAAIAASLADVGRRLRETPVTFLIMADPLDFASAAKIISAFDLTRQGGALAVAPTGKVIVAVQPVVVQPLGLAVTEAADAVVLCIDVGRARLAATRRTIELIGRERIVGALLVR